MDFALVSVPAAPVRRKPAHSKEMVNQLLFGEAVKILGTKGDLWIRIRSLHDLYEGWVTKTMLTEVDENAANGKTIYVTSGLLSPVYMDGSPLHIPAGSGLPAYIDGKGVIGNINYEFSGTSIHRETQQPSASLVTSLGSAWLNAPYLWGGRTILGTDCSGFVQVIYKMMGIDLPRDASQQVFEGKPVKRFTDRLPGDLAFFTNRGSITHVGIVLDNGMIIHASGKVRIDRLKKKGIVDSVTGKRGQKLESIRRFW